MKLEWGLGLLILVVLIMYILAWRANGVPIWSRKTSINRNKTTFYPDAPCDCDYDPYLDYEFYEDIDDDLDDDWDEDDEDVPWILYDEL